MEKIKSLAKEKIKVIQKQSSQFIKQTTVRMTDAGNKTSNPNSPNPQLFKRRQNILVRNSEITLPQTPAG